jgi:hypothetical protein
MYIHPLQLLSFYTLPNKANKTLIDLSCVFRDVRHILSSYSLIINGKGIGVFTLHESIPFVTRFILHRSFFFVSAAKFAF